MSEFSKRVLQVVNAIPSGQVASYGQIALYVGFPRGARQVGWILNATDRQPSIKIPWWRVINNAGRISIKENLNSNASIQKKFLESEGIVVTDDFEIDINYYRWQPTDQEVQRFKLPNDYIDDLIQKGNI